MATELDVIVIGAGSAGLAAVQQIQKTSDRFLLINDGAYGTTCARVGCMPSKALIEAANAFHARKKAPAFGIRGGEQLSIDIPAVLQRVRSLRDRFVGGVLRSTQALGERSIAGRARLLGPNEVAVGDQVFRARRLVIATGSRPVMPKPWLALGERVLSTDTFFEQETLPPSMAVIGLGAIGIEMAQALSRLGVEVHAFDSSDALAGVSDPVVADTARQAFGKEFAIHSGHGVELSNTACGIRVQAGPVDMEVGRVLVAIGRKPNLDELGLDALGVTLDGRGLPPFDRTTMQIGDLPVFIAGDANADASLLHEAADEGFIAGVNAVADVPTCFQRRPGSRGGRGRSGARLFRQLRYPPCHQPRLRGGPQAACVGGRGAFRRAGVGVRPAPGRLPVLPLPVSRGGGCRGGALRGDGRVRAADRHRRRHPGGRGAEAAQWLWHYAGWSPAVARQPGHELAQRVLRA